MYTGGEEWLRVGSELQRTVWLLYVQVAVTIVAAGVF
jgi:hypothetical protein